VAKRNQEVFVCSLNLRNQNEAARRASHKATHQHTKSYNSRLVLRTIYDHGQVSRADVARVTALSRTTVSEVVTDLLAQGLVEEVGFGLSNGGKTPILLQVRDSARCLIGVDLSREEFRGAAREPARRDTARGQPAADGSPRW